MRFSTSTLIFLKLLPEFIDVIEEILQFVKKSGGTVKNIIVSGIFIMHAFQRRNGGTEKFSAVAYRDDFVVSPVDYQERNFAVFQPFRIGELIERHGKGQQHLRRRSKSGNNDQRSDRIFFCQITGGTAAD